MRCDKCGCSDTPEEDLSSIVIPPDNWIVFCPTCSKKAKKNLEQVLKVLEAVQQL